MKDYATSAQIEYAISLLTKLGYDLDDYDFDNMSGSECAELIDELKREWE